MTETKRLILLLATASMTLGGCASQDGDLNARICADSEVESEIKGLIFGFARKAFDGEVRYVNDLSKQLTFELLSPVATSIDEEIGRVDCEARAKLQISPSVQDHFGREEELIADIGFSVQNTADGSDRVYRAAGTEPLVLMLLRASSSLNETEGLKLTASDKATPSKSRQDICGTLWLERNTIFAEAGQCFKSKRAIEQFGSNCFEPYGKLSSENEARVTQIRQKESDNSCQS